MNSEGKILVKYMKGLGIDIHLSTKARGNLGFFLKNRIDISKEVPTHRFIPTLLHEFTHYIHSKIEPDMARTGGSLKVIFDTDTDEIFQKELVLVTNFVDKSSKFEKLSEHKKIIQEKILEYEKIIKNKYPKFMRSKKFKEFDKYIKKSKARYLLKYDRVKLLTGLGKNNYEILSITNIEKDFCDMPAEFAAYIRLKSCQKRQTRISSKINRLKKYYEKPSELFARLVEGLYLDPETVQNIAPHTCYRFFKLLHTGYYQNLEQVLDFVYNPVNL